MSDFAVALAAGLIAGFVGALVGAATMWSVLRDRMDADAPGLQEPQMSQLQLASLRSDLRQLAQQQAMQEDIQIRRLYQWQRDVMRFVDESQKRQAADGGALQRAVAPATATAASTPTAPSPRDAEMPDLSGVPAGAAESSSTRALAPATRGLTDAEIDAVPPELPERMRRRRPAQAPAKPTMQGI